MSESGSWKKILVSMGAVAGTAAVVYYLTKGDRKTGKQETAVVDSKADVVDSEAKVKAMKKEDVQQILKEIIESQDKMKGYMKDLTKELLTQSLDFEQTYERVKKVQPSDPLEKHNLSMVEFDQLLDNHQRDPTVREAIAKIMGAPNPGDVASKRVQEITVKEIIRVHTFMLEELEKLVGDLQGRQGLDMKTVTIAAQAIVGARMEKKFGYTSEDIESAVLMYHTMLATEQEFATINMKIQHTMGKLMGNPFPQ